MLIVIFITTKNGREAKKIATKLIEEKLIACANMIKGVNSIFHWKGKVDKASEVLLILKSKKSCFPKIIKIVKKYHSYDVPEIIAMPITDGSRDYLNWVKKNCPG
jgi:periplasmic divalent cation tolerance protein